MSRLKNYLDRWIELSKTPDTVQGLKNLLVKEQFVNCCSQELSTFLQERAPSSLEELTKIANQYLLARGKSFKNECVSHKSKNIVKEG